MTRCFAAGLLSVLLCLAPLQAQAQVIAVIKACKSSVTMIIACVVVERGAEKVLDVGLEYLVDYLLGERDDLGPVTPVVSASEAAAVRATAIPWPEFKAFLLSTFGGTPAEDPAELRRKIGAACAAKYSPVCAQFGFFDPARFTGCDGLDQGACAGRLACTWTGSACARAGGTKELFGR